jgi:pimeloyl-ACP methyl ester carboxylesterase
MPIVDSAGVPIYYEIAGEGPPILLVHGFLSSLEGLWRNSGWIEFLVGRGRSVIAMDCRGHGRSGKPYEAAAYEDPRIPRDVLAVMDVAGLQRVDLMGYSMGGAIALALLARFPERFRSVVVGGAGLPVAPRNPELGAAIAAALEADDVSTISNPVARFFREFAESRAHNPNSLADLNPDLRALAAIARGGGLRSISDAEKEALKQIQVPLLVVVGDKDPALPDAQRLSDTVPSAQLVLLPGEDHLSAVPSAAYKEAVAIFLDSAPIESRNPALA